MYAPRCLAPIALGSLYRARSRPRRVRGQHIVVATASQSHWDPHSAPRMGTFGNYRYLRKLRAASRFAAAIAYNPCSPSPWYLGSDCADSRQLSRKSILRVAVSRGQSRPIGITSEAEMAWICRVRRNSKKCAPGGTECELCRGMRRGKRGTWDGASEQLARRDRLHGP